MSFGTIYSDSESNDPEDWIRLQEAENKEVLRQEKVKKLMLIYHRQQKRMVAKEIVKRAVLKRKVPKKVSKTLRRFPNIAKDIELFAKQNRIWADSRRRTRMLTFSGNSRKGPKLTYMRTGMLTFSGNFRKGPKLTYMRIKKHLEDKYGTKFGYGTIVQLCCSKNKRHLSSKRYWNAARIMSRRARKGFNVKLNIDAH